MKKQNSPSRKKTTKVKSSSKIKKSPKKDLPKGPEGIKNLLLLFVLILLAGFLISAFFVVMMIVSMFTGSFGTKKIIPFILISILTGALGFILNEAIEKKKIFPKIAIGIMILACIGNFIVTIQTNDWLGLITPTIFDGLWIWYFLKSKRVKNTFVK